MFIPKFETITADRYVVADIINKPHEDYPNRVDITADAIKYLQYKFMLNTFVVTDTDTILEVHKMIMHDTPHAGKFRQCQVMIGFNDRGIDYWTIPFAMSRIDVVLNNPEITREWYRQFQQVHPFEDGNGRVGGAIIAAASYLYYFGDRVIVPCQ